MTASPETASGWWYRANQTQKVAQVEAGIELGMTARQVSIASGAKVTGYGSGPVAMFAWSHGLSFPRRGNSAAGERSKRKQSARAAYDRGEPVDFWAEQPRTPAASPSADLEELQL